MKYNIYSMWVLGAIFFMLGAVILGNMNITSNDPQVLITAVIAFAVFAVAGICWITSAINARD